MEKIKGKLLNNQRRNPTCRRKVYAIYIESQQQEIKSKIESHTTTVQALGLKVEYIIHNTKMDAWIQKKRLFIEHSIYLSIEKTTTNISFTRRLYGRPANNLKKIKSTGVRHQQVYPQMGTFRLLGFYLISQEEMIV